MVVEAGTRRELPVLALSPARHRDQQRPAIVAAFSELVTEIANAASVGVDTGFAAGVKAERERVERLYAKHTTAPRVLGPMLLADIRSGATS